MLLLICLGAILAAVPSYLGEMQHQPNWVETMVSHSSAAGGIPSHDHAGGDHAALAKAITLVENDGARYRSELRARRQALAHAAPVLGITGTGGAGKSSLIDELLRRLLLLPMLHRPTPCRAMSPISLARLELAAPRAIASAPSNRSESPIQPY